MNAVEVKKKARDLGADLVGIASIESLAGTAEQAKVLAIVPHAKSVIVIGHRIMRGTLRGIEEGTNFGSTYHCYGMSWMEREFLMKNAFDLTVALEDAGIEAAPMYSTQDDADAVNLDYQVIARAAGLGSMGKGGFFLTREYGHRQRFALIVTDAALEGDKVDEVDFCNGCSACKDACPLDAMKCGASALFERNDAVCKSCRNGAAVRSNSADGVDRYAASCGRACMVALEKKIGQQFENTFRKRSVWTIGPDGEQELNRQAAFTGGTAPVKQ